MFATAALGLAVLAGGATAAQAANYVVSQTTNDGACYGVNGAGIVAPDARGAFVKCAYRCFAPGNCASPLPRDVVPITKAQYGTCRYEQRKVTRVVAGKPQESTFWRNKTLYQLAATFHNLPANCPKP